jgi:hypothetical protein
MGDPIIFDVEINPQTVSFDVDTNPNEIDFELIFPEGPQGENGVGIESVIWLSTGEFKITLTDNSIIYAPGPFTVTNPQLNDILKYDGTKWVNGLVTISESDPTVPSHVKAITSTEISNWNTAFGWGNHAGLYRPISYVPSWSEISSKPTTLSGYGITDAMSTAHPANGITNTNISNWNTAYGWGNHAVAGYLTSESDPIYTASSWYSTTNNSSNWDSAFSWGNHALAGYLVSTGSYSNPSWLASLDWSKISGAPAFITGNQTITLSGDVTGSGAVAITTTIANAAVTYAKIQNVAANSFLANVTGSAATVQAIATNRIPLFSSAITGTPSSTTFLRGDGSWQTVSGGTEVDTLQTVTARGAGTTLSMAVGLASPSARLHVKGSGATSGTLALRVDSSSVNNIFRVIDNGDVYSSAAGGTSTVPRIFGVGDLTTNTAAVFAFGDRLNSLGSHFGSRMLLQSFWGINIDVNRQNGGFKDLNNAGGTSQPCVEIFNSGAPLPTFNFGAALRVRASTNGIQSDPWLSSILELTNSGASASYMRVHPTTGQVIFNGNSANDAAQLQIDSTTKGFLLPRMEGAQLESIATPPAGLMGYANDPNGSIVTSEGWWGYDGTSWVKINKQITSGTTAPSGGVDGDIYLQHT